MPARYPNGARNETVQCDKCGEYYAVTYKRCPFCEDDEPTVIFRRPKIQEPAEELPPRRRRAEPADDEDYPPVRPARPVHREVEEPEDEYEELFRRRSSKEEPEAPRTVRRAPVREESRTEAPPRRRAPRDEEDDEYEEAPKRRSRRYEDDEDEYEEPKRRRRRDDDYDDEDDDDYEPRGRRDDGGRRLVTNARGGGYRHKGPSPLQIIGAVLSIALIVAAIWIVFTIVKTFTGGGKTDPGVTSPAPGISASIPPSATPSETPGGDLIIPSDDPNSQPPEVSGGTDTTPPPVQTTIPDGQTATGFDLGKTEFTLSDTYPTYTFKVGFSPAGSTGSITWSSSKPNIVSVDQNGKVSAVAQGVATITATMAGGYSKQCMVRSTYGGTPGALPSAAPSTAPSAAPSTAPSASPSTGGALSFNVTNNDFTLKIGETWNLKVKNAAGAVSWSIKDSSVATVDANGKVVGVAKGSTKVTATVDGQTLECIVRVS